MASDEKTAILHRGNRTQMQREDSNNSSDGNPKSVWQEFMEKGMIIVINFYNVIY